MRYLIAAGVIALTSCAQAQEQTATERTAPESTCLVGGQWLNDRGSAVTLSCEGERLKGVYNTNVGQPDKGQSFPLTGWAQGDNLSFTVSFKGYGSITAWVGQVETVDGADQLKTLWHLTRNVEDAAEADDMWKSVTSGASVFTRAKRPNN